MSYYVLKDLNKPYPQIDKQTNLLKYLRWNDLNTLLFHKIFGFQKPQLTYIMFAS